MLQIHGGVPEGSGCFYVAHLILEAGVGSAGMLPCSAAHAAVHGPLARHLVTPVLRSLLHTSLAEAGISCHICLVMCWCI